MLYFFQLFPIIANENYNIQNSISSSTLTYVKLFFIFREAGADKLFPSCSIIPNINIVCWVAYKCPGLIFNNFSYPKIHVNQVYFVCNRFFLQKYTWRPNTTPNDILAIPATFASFFLRHPKLVKGAFLLSDGGIIKTDLACGYTT